VLRDGTQVPSGVADCPMATTPRWCPAGFAEGDVVVTADGSATGPAGATGEVSSAAATSLAVAAPAAAPRICDRSPHRDHDLTRSYGFGEAVVHALRGVDLTIRASSSPSWDRPGRARPR
jgi:hypothetical protein